MKTSRRICRPGLTYQIRSRCIELRPMLKEDRTKELMLQIIVWAQKKYRFELHAFDIMDIDFIFIIKTVPDGETISRIMQYIKSQFARRFNARHSRTGPFWNERFHDKIIDFLPQPAISFIKIIEAIRKKNNKYSCWCSNAMIKCINHKKKIKKEVMAGIHISHHKFFNVLGSSLKEQAAQLIKMDYLFRELDA